MSSTKGSSNKTQKTHHEGGGGGGGSAPPTLVKALLKEAAFLRNLVEMTSVPQTFRLLTTCKELLAVEKDVFEKHKLPVVCDMMSSSFGRDEGNGFKLYRAMVGTPNSRWMEWLDTSGVEELILPSSVTDEEMLIMFSGERFSELRTLNLCGCSNITDTSVLEVARRCSNLQSLNLAYCSSQMTFTFPTPISNITDASMLEVARRCSNLQTLYLDDCSNITSACKNALRQSHPKLELDD